VVQEALFGRILLRKHKMFDTVFAAEDAWAQVDQQYQ